MPQDALLSLLDDVQRGRPAPPMRTVPPTAGSDPPDYYRGKTFSPAQIDALASEMGISYDEARVGVEERGGRVLGAAPSASSPAARPAPAMPASASAGMLAPSVPNAPLAGSRGRGAGPTGTPLPGGRAAAAGAPDPLLALLDVVQSERRDPSLLDRAIPMGLRIGGTVVGGVLGAPLGPAGIIGGGAVGSGLGESAAEYYEQQTGQRESLNPTQIATQTALGAVPMGRYAGATIPQIVARRGVQGAAMGGVATTATEFAETGELPAAGDVARGVALGGVLGAGAGRVEGGVLRRAGRLDVPAAAVPELAGLLPPGPRFVVAPDGRVVPVGADVPMTQAPDGSFVRGVPGEYARHEVAGLLPPGREPLITPPPAGSVADDADPSFVRGVPAEYPRREVRGLLPPGPRFVGGSAGVADAATGVDPLLAVLDDVQGVSRQPSQSGGRSVRAAVVERELDPTARDARAAVRVRQYSGDPAAVDAPFVGESERSMLERMRRDLQELPAQRGRLIADPNDAASSIYAHGGAGTPVGDDVRVISGTRASNASILRAVEDLLEGKPITSKLHVAAVDAARGYAEKRQSYRGPEIPEDYGRGGDDFDQFAAMLDDLEPEAPAFRGREPGEEGFISGQLAMRGGGAVAGAAVGGTQGETTQERVENAALFGLAGAAAPSVLSGMRGRPTAAATPNARPRAVVLPVANSERGPASVPPVGASGQPMREPMRGVDVFLGKFSNPLVRTGIEERLIANNGFAEQRRGTLSRSDLPRLAQQIRVDVSKVLPKGTGATQEAVTAYASAVRQTQEEVSRLSALVNSGNGTDADVLRLERARADADVVLKSLMGMRAEAGRALASFRFLDGIIDSQNNELIRGAADQLRHEAHEFAQAFTTQPPDAIARYRWLQERGKPTLWDTARSYYYSSILSGVRTHERNILGNVFNFIGNTAAHPFAAGADAVRSASTGAPRTVLAGELPHGLVGAAAGVERGFADALFTLREGVNPQALDRSLKAAEAGKLDLPRVEFPGGGKNPFNYPGRALDAADVFFRSVARNTEMYEAAYTRARNEGLTGQRLVDRMAQLRTGQTPEGAAIRENAEHVASRAVFQEKGGPVTSWLSQGYRIPGIGQAMTFVVPFLRTPGNILRQGLETSPAGFGMTAARQGGRRGAQAQGRAAMGSLAAGYLAWLAATGRLSGSGPSDPDQRAALMEAGWRPNSVRIGDQWVSYQLFQPVSVQAALIANAYESWRERGGDQKDAVTVAAQTMARGANSFLEQSFMSGLFDMYEALKDPERSGHRLAGRLMHSLTPFSGFQRTVRDAMDPVQRQPRTALAQMQAGMPGQSEQVPPRIDRFGDVVVREGGPLRRALDPFAVSSVKTDPIAEELTRLGLDVSLPARTVSGETLTPEQAVDVQQRRGRATRAALERVIRQPQYQQWTDAERVEQLERAVQNARAQATREVRRDLVTARVGSEYTHARFGRVRLLGAMANGTVRVVRVLPEGAIGGRHFIVRPSELTEAAP